MNKTVRRTTPDESGMAMITAILVSVVVLFLGFIATGLSDHSFSSSRVDHKRITTFHAAEGGIDEALQVLQTTPLATLPCSAPLARSLGGGAYAPDYVVTFTYYASYPVAGAPLACPLAAEPAAVVVRSVGGSSDPLGSERSVEATIRLAVPNGLGAFPHTIFSDQTVEYDGPVELGGNGTRVADIFSNGSINCDRMQSLDGNIVVRGAATLSNACSLMGGLTAGTSVSATGNAFVGGDVIARTGDVTLASGASVSGDVEAGGAINAVPAAIGGNRNPGSSSPIPAATSLPTINDTDAAWTAAGFTILNRTCPGALTELMTNASGWTTPRVLRVSSCRLDVPASTTIGLKSDVAIVSAQGFDLAASSGFTTSTPGPGGSRLLLLVPSGSSCSASLGRVVMGANITFGVPLRVFAYTPCLIEARNIALMQGQLYGGSVRFGGLRLNHADVGIVPGYVPGTLDVDREVTLVAKREAAL